jgi:disulfide oxidoreductase YuzD
VEARNANLKYKIYKAKMEGKKCVELPDCDTYTVKWLKGLFGSKFESTYNRNRKADVKITF